MTPTTVKFVPFQQEGVTFDAADHVYRYFGNIVPGVTGLLKRFQQSSNFTGVAADVLEHKRDIGHAAHTAAHYFDEGDLDPATVHPEVQGYLASWQAFTREMGFRPFLLETPLVHDIHGYGGTLDRWGIVQALTVRDEPAIVDIKTGDPKDAAAHTQTAAYEQLVRSNIDAIHRHLVATGHNLPWDVRDLVDLRWKRYSVQLMAEPTPRRPFLLHPYEDRHDYTRWLACSTLAASAHPSWAV